MKQGRTWKWRINDPQREVVAWFPTVPVFADSEVVCSMRRETHDHYGRPIEERLQEFVRVREVHDVTTAPCPLCGKPMDLTDPKQLDTVLSGSPNWQPVPAHAACCKAQVREAEKVRREPRVKVKKSAKKNRRRRG